MSFWFLPLSVYSTTPFFILGDWGDWRVKLEPNADTNTLGRDNFFLHGGSKPGSAGCIDIGGGTFGNSQSNTIRDFIQLSDEPITVTVI